jgi:hypothetical protein
MQVIFDDWARSFYSRPFLDLILIVAFIISVKKKNVHNILRFFPFYISALFIVYLSLDIYLFFPIEIRRKIIRLDFLVDHLFTLFELLIFSDFFIRLIVSRQFKVFIKFLTVLFVLGYLLVTIKHPPIFFAGSPHRTINTFYTLQAVLLIVFCIMYFIELFKKPPVLILLREPSFWITTGLFFFMSCTLPYSLLENQINHHFHEFAVELFSIFHIFYSLLFIMIIKAFLCKPINSI